VKGQLQLPIYVKPQITFNQHGGKVNVMVGMKNTQGKPVEDVVITIQFPKTIASASLSANIGQVQFDDITKVMNAHSILSCVSFS
jgi:AP-3 complex subunit mu